MDRMKNDKYYDCIDCGENQEPRSLRIVAHTEKRHMFAIECARCGARGPWRAGATAAVGAWNKRHVAHVWIRFGSGVNNVDDVLGIDPHARELYRGPYKVQRPVGDEPLPIEDDSSWTPELLEVVRAAVADATRAHARLDTMGGELQALRNSNVQQGRVSHAVQTASTQDRQAQATMIQRPVTMEQNLNSLLGDPEKEMLGTFPKLVRRVELLRSDVTRLCDALSTANMDAIQELLDLLQAEQSDRMEPATPTCVQHNNTKTVHRVIGERRGAPGEYATYHLGCGAGSSGKDMTPVDVETPVEGRLCRVCYADKDAPHPPIHTAGPVPPKTQRKDEYDTGLSTATFPATGKVHAIASAMTDVGRGQPGYKMRCGTRYEINEVETSASEASVGANLCRACYKGAGRPMQYKGTGLVHQVVSHSNDADGKHRCRCGNEFPAAKMEEISPATGIEGLRLCRNCYGTKKAAKK